MKSLKRLELRCCENAKSQLVNLNGMLLDSFCFEDEYSEQPQFPIFPNLIELVLSICTINDEWINNLPEFPKVRTLSISNEKITNTSLKFLSKQFPSLTDLDLRSCTYVTDVENDYFPNLMYLKLYHGGKSQFINTYVCR